MDAVAVGIVVINRCPLIGSLRMNNTSPVLRPVYNFRRAVSARVFTGITPICGSLRVIATLLENTSALRAA
jgi:hypothetical protein